jgi:predicted transcriptional regulator
MSDTKTMTLTRTLNEIKMLEKKINKYSDSSVLWLSVSKNGQVSGVQDLAQMKSTVEGNKQKLNDLIDRRNELKKKLLEANNSITIDVAGKTYTIAEAIDRKSFIYTEKNIFSQIKRQVVGVKTIYDQEQARLDQKVENTVAQALQGDGRKDPTVVAGIEKSVRDNLKIAIEDPANIEKWVEDTINEIEEFENEIDFTLSEANAKNTIEV